MVRERSSHPRPPGRTQPAPEAPDLLTRLLAKASPQAWADFLEHFSPLILQVARQFWYREGDLADCYLFVCKELHKNGYHRLRGFRQGRARFETWLRAVVRNLSLDWRRSVLGGPQLFRSIAGLDAIKAMAQAQLTGRNKKDIVRLVDWAKTDVNKSLEGFIDGFTISTDDVFAE